MILETFSQDGEWSARQVDYVMVTKQGITMAGVVGEMGVELKPDDYLLIEALTDTRQPLRTIVDTRKAAKRAQRRGGREVARKIRNARPNTQSRYIDVPEEE
jgi:hypothetical protein